MTKLEILDIVILMLKDWEDSLDCLFIEISVQCEDAENVTYDFELLDDTISRIDKNIGFDTRNDALEVAILKAVNHFNKFAP